MITMIIMSNDYNCWGVNVYIFIALYVQSYKAIGTKVYITNVICQHPRNTQVFETETLLMLY